MGNTSPCDADGLREFGLRDVFGREELLKSLVHDCSRLFTNITIQFVKTNAPLMLQKLHEAQIQCPIFAIFKFK